MNKLLKLLLCGAFVLNINLAHADDEDVDFDTEVEEVTQSDYVGDVSVDVAVAPKVVSQRMDCKTMKTKIDELSLSGEDATELDNLRKKYRKDCVMRANGRSRNARSAYVSSIVIATAENASNQDTSADTQARAARRGNAASQTAGGKNKAMSSMASASILKSVVTSTSDSKEKANTEKSTGDTISEEQIKMCDNLLDKMATFDKDTKALMKETYDSYCAKGSAAPDNVIKMTLLALGGLGDNSAKTTESGETQTDQTAVVSSEPEGPTEEEILEQQIANLEAGLCADGTNPNKYGCCTGEKFKDMGNLEFACCPEEGGDCFPPMF